MKGKLITLLEKEAKCDIKDISVTDKEVTRDVVRAWYFEAEKVSRVISNLLSEKVAFQAINQLRYAGHHLLRAEDPNNQQELIEAYKHCKRAYFDTLDFYVYRIAEIVRNKTIYINANSRDKITIQLKQHLKKIQQARFEMNNRIDYYQLIQKELIISGADILEQANQELAKSGYAKEMTLEKAQLINENKTLEDNYTTLKNNIGNKLNLYGIILTIFIVVTTSIGYLFQGALTNYFNSPVAKVEPVSNSITTPTLSTINK